jgi:hypothetical protein
MVDRTSIGQIFKSEISDIYDGMIRAKKDAHYLRARLGAYFCIPSSQFNLFLTHVKSPRL